MGNSRVVVWFSCGAASAVAAKIASEKYGDELSIVYCDVSKDEHEDNPRFMRDVEKWTGRKVTTIKSEKYDTTEEVFWDTRYIAGPRGARCTVEMKKVPRFKFQQPDDLNIFGFCYEEINRIRTFISNNPELHLEWNLLLEGLTKHDCYEFLQSEGIELPMMYRLGFRNNNCKGCVKSTSPGYWNKTRECFPEVFKSRAEVSRALNVRLVQLHGKRIFLDELPEGVGKYERENISCGPECAG